MAASSLRTADSWAMTSAGSVSSAAGAGCCARLASVDGPPKTLASVPEIRPSVAMPVSISVVPATRPFSVIGTMSP